MPSELTYSTAALACKKVDADAPFSFSAKSQRKPRSGYRTGSGHWHLAKNG